MEVLEPRAVEIIKGVVDRIYPAWRQVGSNNKAEKPSIVVVRIDEVPHAVATGTGVDVFGAGHLGMTRLWQEGGRGAAVKSHAGAEELRKVGEGQIMGFVHFHRSVLADTVVVSAAEEGSPIAMAVKFFTEHEGEFSAFVPVVFEKSGDQRYPWRALPPP